MTLSSVALWEYLDSKWLFVGYLNGGGPDISISTMNGTITIRQAK